MTIRIFTEPPALAGLYLCAARSARKRPGHALPDSAYTLADQSIDADHLAGYQRLCSFRVGDVLPLTYLHVIAFRLAMALMVEPAFPFPAPGLVHIANSIEARRPVRLDETVTLRVHAADLRPHDAGQQFDVLTEASVHDEPVWSERSSYLHRERSRGPRPPREPGPQPPAVPALIQVPRAIGRRYAAVSGDRNPIHLHPLAARAFGFPRMIAHGMWLAARTLATLDGRRPGSAAFDVAFKTPVLLPATVEVLAVADGATWSLNVRDARSGKPHLAGLVRPLSP